MAVGEEEKEEEVSSTVSVFHFSRHHCRLRRLSIRPAAAVRRARRGDGAGGGDCCLPGKTDMVELTDCTDITHALAAPCSKAGSLFILPPPPLCVFQGGAKNLILVRLL